MPHTGSTAAELVVLSGLGSVVELCIFVLLKSWDNYQRDWATMPKLFAGTAGVPPAMSAERESPEVICWEGQTNGPQARNSRVAFLQFCFRAPRSLRARRPRSQQIT